MNENILLVGGTGFIGKPLIKKITKNYSVKIMIHSSEIQTDAQQFRGNIVLKNSFINEIRQNETIINLVGQMTDNQSNLINSNVIGSLNLLNSCLEKNIKKIIVISTINVYGENFVYPSKETDTLNPKTNYGLVKMITERIYQYFSEIYGINVTILRLAGIYGPTKKSGFLTEIIKSINDPKLIPSCNNFGKQERDILFIDDAVDGIKKSIDYSHDGFEIFNISSGKKYSINELISKLEKISNKKLHVNFNSEIPDERCIWADNSKAKKLLNFNPQIDVDLGLKIMVDKILK